MFKAAFKHDSEGICNENSGECHMNPSIERCAVMTLALLVACIAITAVPESDGSDDAGSGDTFCVGDLEYVIEYDDVMSPEDYAIVLGFSDEATDRTTVSIPSKVEAPDGESYYVRSIGDGAFSGCSELRVFDGGTYLSDIGNRAFQNCTSLSEVRLGHILSVGLYAFQNCTSLTSFPFIDSLSMIYEGAFSNSGLMSISIDHMVTIGSEAFRGCSDLESVDIIVLNSQSTGAFRDCTNLESVSISTCEILPWEVFMGCTDLSSVSLPSNLKEIRDAAFSGCTDLRSIELPDSLTNIGWYTFQGCSSLASIELPSGVSVVGQEVFEGCSGLVTVHLSSCEYIHQSAFEGCTSLGEVVMSDSLKSVGYNAFKDCTSLRSVEFPASVISTGAGVFVGCTSLETVTFEEGLQVFGANMFDGCKSLTRFNIPASVEGNHVGLLSNYTVYDSNYQVLSPNCLSQELVGHTYHVRGEPLVFYMDGAPTEFTVHVDLKGGDASFPSSWRPEADGYYREYPTGTFIDDIYDDLVEPQRDRYEFIGWEGPNGGSLDHDIFISATWERSDDEPPVTMYTVTIDTNGGVADPDSSWAYRNGVYTKQFPASTSYSVIIHDFGEVTKEGYTLDYWDGSSIYLNSDMFMTAVWIVEDMGECRAYLDGFDSIGGSTESWYISLGGGMLHRDFPYGTSYSDILDTAGTPTKEGYAFTGWSPSEGILTEDTVFTAQWEPLPKYTITFDLGGGRADADSSWDVSGTSYSKEFWEGTNVGQVVYDFPSPIRDGFVFRGWDASGGQLSEDTIITARWTPESQMVYTVRVDYDGGNYFYDDTWWMDGAIAMKTFSPGQGPEYIRDSITEPFMDGHSFAGWEMSVDSVNGYVDLRAIWAEDPDGGSGDVVIGGGNGSGSGSVMTIVVVVCIAILVIGAAAYFVRHR